MGFTFDEIVGAAGAIGRVLALGNDAFELHVAGVLEDRRTVGFEMLGEADAALIAHSHKKSLQRRFALDQRLAGRVATVEIKEIEDVIDKTIVAAILQIGLQQRKTRNAFVVLHHQFAVEQRGFGWQRRNRRGDRLEAVRPIEPLARQQLDLAVIEARFDTIAVVFDLMQPFPSARRSAVQGGKTGRDEIRKARVGDARASFPLDCLDGSLGISGRAVRMPDPLLALAGGDLLDRAAGRGRLRLILENVLVARPARRVVLALDQEPVVVAVARLRAQPHQMPTAAQFLALKLEFQMALGEAFVRVALGMPVAAVPDHHGATAILSLRNRALELVIFDGMILDMDGKPLVVGIKTWAAGDSPAFHHTVELEPQIVMQPTRGVLLNDVGVAATSALGPATRLRRDAEFSLFAVNPERHDQLARLRRLVLAAPCLRAAALERVPRDLPRCSPPPPRPERTERRNASIRLMTLLGRSGGVGAGLPACFALISALSASS